MSNLNQISRKIKSVKLTNRLTRALEVISQTQFHLYKDLQKKSLPYLQGIYKIFYEIFNNPEHDVRLTNKKLISIEASKGTLWVVMATDIGMCGDFNDKLKGFLADSFDVDRDGLVVYGNRLLSIMDPEILKNLKHNHKSEIDSSMIFKSFKSLSQRSFELFMHGNYQRLALVYLKNPKLGTIEKINILPFENKYLQNRKKNVYVRSLNAQVSFPDSVIELFPQYLECVFMGALINSKIAEHGIRRELMHSAAKNAAELLDEYVISFNKLRQEKITQEITEIVGAMQSKKKGC